MRYIFKNEETPGELPIKNFQIAWYDKNWKGFDESFVEPEKFTVHDLIYVETEKETQNNIYHSKVFVNMKNGDSYELVLRKCNPIET